MGLGAKTLQGFGLHPIVSQRIDAIFKIVTQNKAEIAAVKAGSVSPVQAKTIAASAVQTAIASLPAPGSAQQSYAPITQLFVDGLIPTTGGTYVITKTSAFSGTLGFPTVANGTVLRIFSATPFAHSVTTTGFILPGLLLTGTAATQGAHYAAHPGAGMVLMAYNNVWIVVSSQGISFF